jgi:hypothetical protein
LCWQAPILHVSLRHEYHRPRHPPLSHHDNHPSRSFTILFFLLLSLASHIAHPTHSHYTLLHLPLRPFFIVHHTTSFHLVRSVISTPLLPPPRGFTFKPRGAPDASQAGILHCTGHSECEPKARINTRLVSTFIHFIHLPTFRVQLLPHLAFVSWTRV